MDDLIKRLRAYATERYLGARCPNLVHEAADAIAKLAARAEKAEADLAAARAALDDAPEGEGDSISKWRRRYAATIEAARKEVG